MQMAKSITKRKSSNLMWLLQFWNSAEFLYRTSEKNPRDSHKPRNPHHPHHPHTGTRRLAITFENT